MLNHPSYFQSTRHEMQSSPSIRCAPSIFHMNGSSNEYFGSNMKRGRDLISSSSSSHEEEMEDCCDEDEDIKDWKDSKRLLSSNGNDTDHYLSLESATNDEISVEMNQPDEYSKTINSSVNMFPLSESLLRRKRNIQTVDRLVDGLMYKSYRDSFNYERSKINNSIDDIDQFIPNTVGPHPCTDNYISRYWSLVLPAHSSEESSIESSIDVDGSDMNMQISDWPRENNRQRNYFSGNNTHSGYIIEELQIPHCTHRCNGHRTQTCNGYSTHACTGAPDSPHGNLVDSFQNLLFSKSSTGINTQVVSTSKDIADEDSEKYIDIFID